MKHRAEKRTGEVLNFATTTDSYTIYVDPDIRLDVAKVSNQQQPDSLEAFMWVQAVQGFFVLQQDLEGPRPWPWRLILEIIPESFSSSFFPYVDDEFFRLLADWREVASEELDNNPDGEREA